MLNQLSPDLLKEVEDFTAYLLERQAKRAAFEKRALRSEKLPRKKFRSVDALMKAVDEAD